MHEINKKEEVNSYSFPSIFSKIKDKPRENAYPDGLIFKDFNPAKILYQIPYEIRQGDILLYY